MTSLRMTTQILIIGSGITGCTAALSMANQGYDVTMVTSGSSLDNGNTALAQGGIVFSAKGDSPALLEKDMLKAGWNLNYKKALRFLCKNGPQAVQDILIDQLKVPFDAVGDQCSLTREGGHSLARIAYCADYTGRAIMDKLSQAVTSHPKIQCIVNRTAIDLLTIHHHSKDIQYRYQLTNRCIGAYVLNELTSEVETIMADCTVLATGGVGQVYLHTTNTPSSIGSGISMATRAGARVVNAEFIQFHPTALFHRASRKFLISEAVRGEGAKIINAKGEHFITKYDPRAELAPRDIVTRAIVDEMFSSGEDCVYLDTTPIQQDFLTRFPTISAKCKDVGIDPLKQPIPVVPAAHYFCGGILVDNKGRTTLEGLYAGGECACSGVHGANRLASTSLLESLLWGWGIGKDITRRYKHSNRISNKLQNTIPDWISPGSNLNEDPALISQDWAAIRHTMWNYVGIIRTSSRLQRAFEDLRHLYKRLNDFYGETPISKPIVDLFHGCQAAYTITTAAIRNKESQGCHFRKN